MRFLIGVLLLPVLGVCAWQAWPALQPVLRDPAPLSRFGIGVGIYLAAWVLWLRRQPESMWSAFEHELTHAIFCVVFWKKVHEFHAGTKSDAKGRSGVVVYDDPGGFRNTIILLAPYFFPTLTVTLLVLRAVIAPPLRPGLDVAIGISFAYHFFAALRQVGMHQSDIRENGVFFSAVFLALANLIMTMGTLLLLHGGPQAPAHWLKASAQQMTRLVPALQKKL